MAEVSPPAAAPELTPIWLRAIAITAVLAMAVKRAEAVVIRASTSTRHSPTRMVLTILLLRSIITSASVAFNVLLSVLILPL